MAASSRFSWFKPRQWFSRQSEDDEITRGSKIEMEEMVVSCLGRPFTLGRLYDARREEVLSASSLSSEISPQNLETQDIRGTDTCALIGDIMSEKMAALDISPQEKLGILSDLVRVSGSGQYLLNRVVSNLTSRCTATYKCTSKFIRIKPEILDTAHLTINTNATHVVIGIEYGARAFLIFDKVSSDRESLEEDQTRLASVISMIVNNENTLRPDEKFWESLKFRFVGDVHQYSNITTFAEAVDIYYKLPSLMTEQKHIPLKAWLYPIRKLNLQTNPDVRGVTMMREISSLNVDIVERRLEELWLMSLRGNDLLKTEATKKFANFKARIKNFNEAIIVLMKTFRDHLRTYLPRVKSGREREDKLLLQLHRLDRGPFDILNMNHWLNEQEGLANVLAKYLSEMEETESVKQAFYPGASTAERFDSQREYVVMLEICVPRDDKKFFTLTKPHYPGGESLDYPQCELDIDSTLSSYISTDGAANFIELVKANNNERDETLFVVTDQSSRADKSGCFIQVYQKGSLITEDFLPPSKPGNLRCIDVGLDSLKLLWSKPKIGGEHIRGYRIVCQADEEDVEINSDTTETEINVKNLKPGTSYSFTVQTRLDFCFGIASAKSNIVTTLASSAPGVPSVKQTSPEHCALDWSRPLVVAPSAQIIKYIIQVERDGELSDLLHESRDVFSQIKLEPGYGYRFRVAAVLELSASTYSEFSRKIIIASVGQMTDSDHSSFKLVKEGSPSLYKLLPIMIHKNEADRLEKLSIGMTHDRAPRKTILLVGATGAGKSTLINAFVNYVMGIKWDDGFRYLLIEDRKDITQAHSQTKWVTAYTINHKREYRVPYTLTIVDTPGYGDTAGIDHDKMITSQLGEFFKAPGNAGIDSLDAVGFVIPSSLPRLTPTQKYIFNSILSLFGKDIEDSIFALLTFADGKHPPVLDALKESALPVKSYFKFNNSVLFSDNLESHTFDKTFWQMGECSYRDFFTCLQHTNTISLVLTNAVLEERRQLEAHITGIQTHIREGVIKMDELHMTGQVLQDHEAEIARNENFSFMLKVPKIKTVDLEPGRYVTNCLICNRTCHYPCVYANNADKNKCAAMNRSTGCCNVCQLHCSWEFHVNNPFRFEVEEVEEIRSFDKLKEKYEKAAKSKLSAEEIIERIIEELSYAKLQVSVLVNDARKSLNRLGEIALKPNPLSTLDYVDLLIESERLEGQRGWQTRVKQLKNVRDQVATIDSIVDGKELMIFDISEKTVSARAKFSAVNNGSSLIRNVLKNSKRLGQKVLSLWRSENTNEDIATSSSCTSRIPTKDTIGIDSAPHYASRDDSDGSDCSDDD